MIEPRRRLRLATEARHHVRVAGHLGRQHLDRDRPIEPQIVGEEDDAHAARAEDLTDPVPPLENVREPSLELGERAAARLGLVEPRIYRRPFDLATAKETEPGRLGQPGNTMPALLGAGRRAVRRIGGAEPVEERHGDVGRRASGREGNRGGVATCGCSRHGRRYSSALARHSRS
jgi:hypothetical protein